MKNSWEVLVVGAGHAGIEAALAASRLGARVGLICFDFNKAGFLSCNPAVGGLAKGQLVKEVDALGGAMAKIADQSTIQWKQLNRSKGPAVRSTRVQCDKNIYPKVAQSFLKKSNLIEIIEAEAESLIFDGQSVFGVRCVGGAELTSRAVVLTTGTFLKGLMHCGSDKSVGGRIGESASGGLSDSLRSVGVRLVRLKTGTPPRLHRDSINYSVLEEQPGDLDPKPFSFFHEGVFPVLPQLSCYMTYSNARTHAKIAESFHLSPIFNGSIEGVGPRYCPSIEDKIHRFRDKERHQIFLEPETGSGSEVYVNGASTSLPKEIQEEFIRSIPGLENAQFMKYGYAVEYDSVDPTQLKSNLEFKSISGLFSAGQINGTSGYEEAAGQGILAGINAALMTQGREPFVLERKSSYIGVMVDDLITKGNDFEPYRMFTSRAENRLFLREDNAVDRLSLSAFEVGALSESDYRKVAERRKSVQDVVEASKKIYFKPGGPMDSFLTQNSYSALKDRVSFFDLMKRPRLEWRDLVSMIEGGFLEFSEDIFDIAQTEIRYEGYLKRSEEFIDSLHKNEKQKIPFSFDYDSVSGLSIELRDRLKKVQPESLGQLARVPGVTPAAVASVYIHMKTAENKGFEVGHVSGV